MDESELQALYEDYGFPAISGFWTIVKREFGSKYTYKDVKRFYDKQAIGEVFKKAKKKDNGMIFAIQPNSTLQIDLIDMQKFSHANGGFHYIAVIVDVYSRKMWAFPLKSKEAADTFSTLSQFLKEHKPHQVMTDFGGEWLGPFSKLLETIPTVHDRINVKVDGHKALGVVDRNIATLKDKLYKFMDHNKNTKWLEILQRSVSAFNKTPHSFLISGGKKTTPNDIYDTPNPEYLGRIISIRQRILAGSKPQFKEGDEVRIRQEGAFHRGFQGTYSREIYTVKSASSKNVVLTTGKKVPNDRVLLSNVPIEVVNPEMVKAVADNRQDRALAKEGVEKNAAPAARPVRERKAAKKVNVEAEPKKARKAKEQYTIDRVFGHKIEKKKFYVRVHYTHLDDAQNEPYQWQDVTNFVFRDDVGDRSFNPLVLKYLQENKLMKTVDRFF